MLSTRVLSIQATKRVLATPTSSSSSSSSTPSSGNNDNLWESLKSKFKGKFMIGDTYKDYVDYRSGVNRFPPGPGYRTPTPGSQPEPLLPRGPPELEFNPSYYKRPLMKLTPSGGPDTPQALADKERLVIPSATYNFLARHIPQPAWMFNKAALKRHRRFYLETGITLPGVPTYLMQTTYRPVEKFQTREEWEQVPVIRDIRQPRL